ncbi:MAG: glycosyltransferase family 2 protein [Elusimicrobia bacterium]|nr:glycosyltransferase family 2 protein [Elusimicrobiota bacterium]
MSRGKSLSIVVPAYNEEQAIEDILSRCLAAREPLCRRTGLSRVEVIAVDDGSADRTKALIAKFSEVRLVAHPRNLGYGRALLSGFERASGDYLAFLDADGTCDPAAFADLYQALVRAHADLAVGNRLHEESQMPGLRYAGNLFYGWLISRLTGVEVSDSASGMRLFKRQLLRRLKPLPSGLHFTPAMTARAACLGLRIVEAPIPYFERRGRSKLNVLADGLRFLRVILGIIFSYHPLKIFGSLGVAFGLVALGYGAGPVKYYWDHRELREDMIYRLLTILTLMVCSMISLAFGMVAQTASNIAVRRPAGWLEYPRLREGAVLLGFGLALGGILLNSDTILEYVSSGRITLHWIYVLAGGLAVILGTVLFCFGTTLDIVAHLPKALEEKPED